jgi:hypothetical protein
VDFLLFSGMGLVTCILLQVGVKSFFVSKRALRL